MKRDHMDMNAFVSIDFERFCNKHNEHFANENSDDLATKSFVWLRILFLYENFVRCISEPF